MNRIAWTGIVVVVFTHAAVGAAPRPQRPPQKAAPASTSRLAALVQQADLVVVGTLGKLTPSQAEHDQAVVLGDIAITQVLKGPADLKKVTLRTIDPKQAKLAPWAVVYAEGTESVWLLTKNADTRQYLPINPSVLPPKANLTEVKRILGLKETSPSKPASSDDETGLPPATAAERPQPSASETKTGADPKTASLAAALEDWIKLLEGDDLKTANARWSKDKEAADKIADNWTGLKECHQQHDYRNWLKQNTGDGSKRLQPGGAETIGNKTAFRVGGHWYGHLHVLWEKTGQGWRIASILQCL